MTTEGRAEMPLHSLSYLFFSDQIFSHHLGFLYILTPCFSARAVSRRGNILQMLDGFFGCRRSGFGKVFRTACKTSVCQSGNAAEIGFYGFQCSLHLTWLDIQHIIHIIHP